MTHRFLSQVLRRMSSSSSGRASSPRLNRLANETSPYLQQHKFNPVDWYPWGQEAFRAAKESNKPILLSIGYSTCHWCHVMERESFENQEIAEIMNDGFVNIKVDREERPDVDRHYMAFVQGITGGGGWPLTVFLAPDLTPFFGGTYFPPKDSGQQLGFPGILRLIQQKWSTDGEELKRGGAEVLKAIERASVSHHHRIEDEQVKESRMISAVAEASRHLEHTYDRTFGGFGGAPKFPSPPTLALLLRLAFNKDPKTCNTASEMLVGTLEKMAKGGIHDHIEGGFHRYAVDRQWHLPHFEKMLYDQGQLMSIYSSAYALHPLPIFKAAVNGIYDYVTKHLQSETGAFFCAEDADSLPTADASERKEGAFALWSQAELEECLGKKELYEPFIKHYGVLPEGNIDRSKDPHGEMANLNVLDVLNASPGDLLPPCQSHLEHEEVLNEARHLVATRRAKRPRPGLDDKILTAWNGLMISGLARAYRVFGLNERYSMAAQKAADFILEKMYDEQIGLHRIYKPSGHASIAGFADDYAYFIQALLDLYEATLDQKYHGMAVKLQSMMSAAFWDGRAGVFVASKNPELPMQHIVDDYDGAEPSSNSIAALNLGRLYLFTGERDYKEQQANLFAAFSKRLSELPFSMPSLLDAFLFSRLPPTMAVIDAASIDDATELKQTALSTYNHGLVVKANIGPAFNRASAHVCRGTACSAPVYDSESLATLLKQE